MDSIKSHIESLAKKSAEAEKADEAMKFAQAAQNIAQALASYNGATAPRHE